MDKYIISDLNSDRWAIKQYGEIELSENISEIPFEYFKNCQTLRKIILPDNLLKIGTNAFLDCFNLEEVVISNNSKLEIVGYHGFSGCARLKSFYVPSFLNN